MKSNISYSSNLFNTPSFRKGASRVWDLFGNLDTYKYSDTENEADVNALKNDWKMIGSDIKNVLKKYESVVKQYYYAS